MPGAAFRVAELRAEHEVNPTGVVATPRLSWVLEASERGQGQGGFHLLASSTPEKLAANEGDLWKTKERSNGQRLLIPWNGQALKSGQKVFWKVKVLSLKGEESEWSAPAHFTVGAERKFGKVTRISGFESSNAVLNEIYQRNVVTLGNRLNAYLGGNDQAFGDGHALDPGSELQHELFGQRSDLQLDLQAPVVDQDRPLVVESLQVLQVLGLLQDLRSDVLNVRLGGQAFGAITIETCVGKLPSRSQPQYKTSTHTTGS